MQKWSDSDLHKKARSFAGPLDAIVRERFLFLLMNLAIGSETCLAFHLLGRHRMA